MDLPLNYNSDVVDKLVAVPYRGGVVVEFPVSQIQRVMGKVIVNRGGKAIIPKHGQLTMDGHSKNAESPLGNDGDFYFENTPAGNYRAEIKFADDVCSFFYGCRKVAMKSFSLELCNVSYREY